MANNKSNQNKLLQEVLVKLQKDAIELNRDLNLIIADKMVERYKENLELSYTAKSEEGAAINEYNAAQKEAEAKYNEGKTNKTRFRRKKLSYRHTNTLLNSIKASTDGGRIEIVLDDSMEYEDGKSVSEVYKYLTEGTDRGASYAYKDGDKIQGAKNYSTPKHEFEEHAMMQVTDFILNLDINDYGGRKGRRYYKKWR